MADPNHPNKQTGDESADATRSVQTRIVRPNFVIKATGEEAKNYDFASARIASGHCGPLTSFIEAVGHLVKTCLGGGVLGIHTAYKKCGLITGLVINILAGMLLMHSKYILVSSAQIMYGRLQMSTLSYPELAEAVMKTGPCPKLAKHAHVFRYLIDTIICVNIFGSCSVYSVILARTVKEILEEAELVKQENIRIYIACMVLPCVLIAMILTLKYLAPFSLLGNMLLLILAGSTIYYGSSAVTKSPADFPFIKNAEGFFEFLGVCIFSMEGMGMVLPIENHMRKPKKFPLVLCMGMPMTISVVALIGFFGYWGYGEEARTPITMNFPWHTYPIILRCSLTVVIYVTFALNFWAPFNLVWFYIKQKHNPKKYWCVERAYKAIIVVALILIALVFPNMDACMGFIGSFGISFTAFLFPAAIELIVKWHEPGLGVGKWRLFKCGIVFGFGVFLALMGGYSNVKNMMEIED